MAFVEKRTGLGYAGICTFINSLGLDYITVTGTTVVIDEHLSLSFSMNAVYLSVDGGTSTRISRVNESCSVVITYIEKFFSLNVVDSNGRAYAVIYEKIGESIFWGWNGNVDQWSTYHGFYSLEEITMYNLETSEAYTHTKRLNYPCPLGVLDYSENCIFKGGYKDLIEPNFLACSTVTANQVITFDGTNYYSIGTNVLVEIENNLGG